MKINNINYYSDPAQETCGLAVVNGFGLTASNDGISRIPRLSGTGFAVAGFINTHTCRQMYTAINSAHTIIYQSPVRENSRTGRAFFFIVFDTKKPK